MVKHYSCFKFQLLGLGKVEMELQHSASSRNCFLMVFYIYYTALDHHRNINTYLFVLAALVFGICLLYCSF